MTDRYGIRDAFVFDPYSSVLLAEEEVFASDDNRYGYPVGTVIGHSSYLERTIVDEAGSGRRTGQVRPMDARPFRGALRSDRS